MNVVLALAFVLAFAGPPKLPPPAGRGLPVVAPPEASPEARPEARPEAKPEARPEARPEAQPEAQPEARPEAQPEARPETAPPVVRADPPKTSPAPVAPSTAPTEPAAAASAPKPAAAASAPTPAAPDVRPRRRLRAEKRSATVVLGYRHFRIRDALDRPQDWHFGSLEVSPLRRYVRVNFIAELGIEGGPAARRSDRADMMLLGRLGLGMQYPHVVTPLLEFQAGAGVARVELFQRNDLVFLYTFGLDAGAQIALTRWLYLHAVIGWIRPTLRWPERTASYDRFTFKLGIGF